MPLFYIYLECVMQIHCFIKRPSNNSSKIVVDGIQFVSYDLPILAD